MNKLIWTRKDSLSKQSQFDFVLPGGFKVYSFDSAVISSKTPTTLNCGVYVKSAEPVTLLFKSAIPTIDFRLVSELNVIPPNQVINLDLTVINPCYDIGLEEGGYTREWTLKAGTHIANMVILNTSYTNLFETSKKEFEKL